MRKEFPMTDYNKSADFESAVRSIIGDELKNFRKELKDELPQILNSVFGMNNSLGEAVGAGLDSALGSVINGQKMNARSIANAMARSFVPEINDFFNMSKAQQGGDLLDILTSAQRNN